MISITNLSNLEAFWGQTKKNTNRFLGFDVAVFKGQWPITWCSCDTLLFFESSRKTKALQKNAYLSMENDLKKVAEFSLSLGKWRKSRVLIFVILQSNCDSTNLPSIDLASTELLLDRCAFDQISSTNLHSSNLHSTKLTWILIHDEQMNKISKWYPNSLFSVFCFQASNSTSSRATDIFFTIQYLKKVRA